MSGKDLANIWKNRKKMGVCITVFILLVVTTTTALSITLPEETVYVAGDGRGDYNCNGTDDQIEINEALAYVAENPEFTTVHLKGPNTYVISDSILIGSNVTFQGDSTAVIKLKDRADWPSLKPLITQRDFSEQNITIRGFEIDGNHDGNEEKNKGEGYYNLIYLNNTTNIQVHDMYMHDGHGDGLKVENSSNIQFYNNKVYKLGHEGLYGIQSQYLKAWNNTITCRTNSGLRVWDSNHVKFHDNVIDSFYHWSAGGPGIQIQKSSAVMDDIEVYNNTIYNTYGPGIWLVGYDNSYSTEEAQNVQIHHNIFYSTGTNPNIDWVGGIVTSGFYNTLIENNVFDGTYHTAIALMHPTGYSTDLSPKDTGYTTIVRNNIIVDTLERKNDPEGTGYGVINYLPETHSFILENNCFYNNTAGNYKNANSTGDIYENPRFANQKENDYHLRSIGGRWNGKTWVKDFQTSPCIDAGYPSSDCSNEPDDNGGRINIGRYGNTEEASKSGVMPGYVAWWNEILSPEWRILRTLLMIFLLFCFKIQI